MIPSDLERRILEAKQKVSLLAFLRPKKKTPRMIRLVVLLSLVKQCRLAHELLIYFSEM